MIELARNSRGFTQKEVSIKSAVNISKYNRIERGDIEPSELEIENIAGALHYPLKFFMQYPATRCHLVGFGAILVPINYHAYKVCK